jgi:hypothetical protein
LVTTNDHDEHARPAFLLSLLSGFPPSPAPASSVYTTIPRLAAARHSFTVFYAIMSSQGHQHSGSSVQNYKAHLANAYNELGKELASQKIRVVGNYTLGRVIGEGAPVVATSPARAVK